MPKVGKKRKCKVRKCGSPHDSHGFCSMHSMRFRRYGDPMHVTGVDDRRKACRKANWKLGTAKKTSYLKFMGRHEHRVVAEQMLGRPLLAREVVHHIDGDRHNNHPSNLAVITQSRHINDHRDDLNRGRRAAIKRKKRAVA